MVLAFSPEERPGQHAAEHQGVIQSAARNLPNHPLLLTMCCGHEMYVKGEDRPCMIADSKQRSAFIPIQDMVPEQVLPSDMKCIEDLKDKFAAA